MSLWSYRNILTGLLCLPVLYMWRRAYFTYVTLRKQYEDEKLFNERHNCVLMYSRSSVRGWPPKYELKINTSNLNESLEPYLYFINTAKSTLDIATMRLALKPLFQALTEAAIRGVKVRLMVNFITSKLVSDQFQALLKSGVQVVFYVDKTEKLNYIMHYKYMVKDYSANGGYVCMGSMNFSGMSSILNNYEDVVFTTNTTCVELFNKNFEESWNMINRDNENVMNKTVLREFGFCS